ncbi:hypothetical protein BHE74_00043806 [Ensete ventricosum]|nr:hypothetical protein GW17_00026516 [Ensete ventricosum]RWW49962.1 hypothetical protein BHE74_00043806 [Ensete ventricosum]
MVISCLPEEYSWEYSTSPRDWLRKPLPTLVSVQVPLRKYGMKHDISILGEVYFTRSQEAEAKLLLLFLLPPRPHCVPPSVLKEAGHPEHGVPDVPQIPALERPPLAGAHREGRLPYHPTARRQDMRRHHLRLSLLVTVITAAGLAGRRHAPGPRDIHWRGGRPSPTPRRAARSTPPVARPLLVAVRPHHLRLVQIFHHVGGRLGSLLLLPQLLLYW